MIPPKRPLARTPRWRRYGTPAVTIIVVSLMLVIGAFVVTHPSAGSVGVGAGPAVPPIPTQARPSSATTASSLEGLTPLTVSQVLAGRADGTIHAEPVAVKGYWSNRAFRVLCGSAPATQPGALELDCSDGMFGITELDEPIVIWGGHSTGIVARHTGPALTPYIDGPMAKPLFDVTFINGQPSPPPVPIVVIGHFDDPRAADCRPKARQLCLDRLVVDRIVDFHPEAVPTPGITPSPTPFPFVDPPPAPFTAGECSGDVPYSFVGWGHLADYGVDIGDPGDVAYLMVTRDKVDLGDPGGPVGRRVCYAYEWDDASVGYAQVLEP